MKPSRLALLTGLVVAIFAATLRADDKPEDYLTKEGQLKEALTVKDVQGGFAGFTGKAWTIKANGEWTLSTVFNQKLTVESKGTLTKEQLATLADGLAKFGLAGLETKAEGKPMANPHQVTILWGKAEKTLTLGTGQTLPKPDPKEVPGRYAGIAEAVTELCKASK